MWRLQAAHWPHRGWKNANWLDVDCSYGNWPACDPTAAGYHRGRKRTLRSFTQSTLICLALKAASCWLTYLKAACFCACETVLYENRRWPTSVPREAASLQREYPSERDGRSWRGETQRYLAVFTFRETPQMKPTVQRNIIRENKGEISGKKRREKERSKEVNKEQKKRRVLSCKTRTDWKFRTVTG